MPVGTSDNPFLRWLLKNRQQVEQGPSVTDRPLEHPIRALIDLVAGPEAAIGLPLAMSVKAPKVGAVAGPRTLAELAPKVAEPIRAYHGSPHDFDKFSLSKIGTGEGAQAYGHGLYFAENEAVAKDYRNRLSGASGITPGASTGRGKLTVGGVPPPEGIAGHKALDTAQDIQGLLYYKKAGYPDMARVVEEQIERRIANWEAGNPQTGIADADMRELANYYRTKVKTATPESIAERPPGKMYEVGLHASPDEFLDWDLPLSQQSETVRKALSPELHQDEFTSAAGKRLVDYSGDTLLGVKLQTELRRNGGNITAALDALSQMGNDKWKALVEGARKLDWEGLKVSSVEKVGTGQHLVNELERKYTREGLGQYLKSKGIKGIRYLDQGSRMVGKVTKLGDNWFFTGSGTPYKTQAEAQKALDASGQVSRNFVVFDDAIIDIMKKYGVALPVAAAMKAQMDQQRDTGPQRLSDLSR